MLVWLEQYGPLILTYLISGGALAGAIYNLIRLLKLGKKTDNTLADFGKQLEVHKSAIIEGFKAAKIPNELKVSLANKVDIALNNAVNKLIEEVKNGEELRTKVMVQCLKILQYTAAAGKLTAEEKAEMEDYLKLLTDKDTTIEV